MGKSDASVKGQGAATAAAADPTLASLFASSAGPVKHPERASRAKVSAKLQDNAPKLQIESKEVVNSSARASSAEYPELVPDRPRKRRRVEVNEDLEGKYLDKLAQEEEREQALLTGQTHSQQHEASLPESSESSSDLNSDLEDLSDPDDVPEADGEADDLPKHEALTATAQTVEAEKIKRTVFLGNVPISCMTSKAAKRALVQHVQSAIDTKHHEKIESIRFRSTAFAADAGPKRAAYAKKEIMQETMKSTHAYLVMNVEAAARKVASKLNGTVLLDRHVRADHLGNPAKVDHRRCVFVGNLSFVDEATDPTGEAGEKRKRAKEPADVDEGLWRAFGKAGKVESVRVVRDKETRVGKGFAYVQFVDENAVEAALLLDGKKFPPMLPRLMRVSRAKKELKREKRARESGRGSDTAKTRGKSGQPGKAAGQSFVFEGNRANSNSMPKGLAKLKRRPASKPTNRSSKRAAAFRAGGGKKKRDVTA